MSFSSKNTCHFICVRVVWNDALAICKQAEKLPSNNDLQKLVITQAKKTVEREWLSEVSNLPYTMRSLPHLIMSTLLVYSMK